MGAFKKRRNISNVRFLCHKSGGTRLWESCMCDINFLIPLPFKPDKERFIKRQEFRVECSGLRSLLHLPAGGEEEGSQHLFQQIESLAKNCSNYVTYLCSMLPLHKGPQPIYTNKHINFLSFQIARGFHLISQLWRDTLRWTLTLFQYKYYSKSSESSANYETIWKILKNLDMF